MADQLLIGNPSPSLAPSAPQKPVLSESDEGAAARTKNFEDQNKALSSKLNEIAGDTRKKNERLESQLELQKPPQLQQAPYKAPAQTNAVEQWGSLAMGFAMLGSLFTRRPMQTALDSAAAVMKGFQAKDQAATKQAYEQWEVANKNALDLANYQQKAYDNLVKSYERRESNNTAAGAAQERAVQAQMNALGAAFKDETMLALGRDRGFAAQEREIARREKEAAQLKLQAERIQRMYAESQTRTQVANTDEYKAAAAAGDSHKQLQLMAAAGDKVALAGLAKMDAHTSLAAAKTQITKADSENRIASMQDYIDRAMELSPQMGRGGLSQMLEKTEERVGGALGMNVENPAQQYDAYIDALKIQILAEKTASSRGTQNQDYRKALDALLPKINHWEGSNGEQTQLKVLSNTLNRVHGLPDRFPDVSAETPKVPEWQDRIEPQQQGGVQEMSLRSPAGQAGLSPAVQPSAPKIDINRKPSSEEAASAKPITGAEQLQSATPGWYKDGKGNIFYLGAP